jgi:hypothetical protein
LERKWWIHSWIILSRDRASRPFLPSDQPDHTRSPDHLIFYP